MLYLRSARLESDENHPFRVVFFVILYASIMACVIGLDKRELKKPSSRGSKAFFTLYINQIIHKPSTFHRYLLQHMTIQSCFPLLPPAYVYRR